MTHHRFVGVVVALGACLPLAAGSAAAGTSVGPRFVSAPAAALPVHVEGTRLVNSDGVDVQIGGVNRSGTEYACAQGWGIFDGPSSAASVAAIATWHVNAVRVPLNEDCWLDLNGVPAGLGGASYRAAIEAYVAKLEAADMNVVLELHLSAPGDELALGQQKMPDADHTPDFWRSVATTFGGDGAVIFDLFNEPHDVTWKCWLRGCTIDGSWRAVGMQRLVNVVRATGAQNVIMLGGIGWSGDITKWGKHRPDDPAGQLVAAWHVYDFGGCTTPTCWARNVRGVRGSAPVVLGEIGETDCAHGFVDPLMDWLDVKGIGYLAWTWDDWPGCDGPTVILDYDGTPSAYGQGIHDHYVSHF